MKAVIGFLAIALVVAVVVARPEDKNAALPKDGKSPVDGVKNQVNNAKKPVDQAIKNVEGVKPPTDAVNHAIPKSAGTTGGFMTNFVSEISKTFGDAIANGEKIFEDALKK